MTTPFRAMARSFPLDRLGPSFDMFSFPFSPLSRTFAYAGFKAIVVRLGYLLLHRPAPRPEGEDRSQQDEADGHRSRRFPAFGMFVRGVAVSEVVNAPELMFDHGSTPFRGCDWEPRSPRGPWPVFRRSNGRPGGIRTRTSPLLPGAPSGHAYSESHGAERYNSRSSHTLSKTSHSSHGRGKLHGLPPGLSNPRCRMWYFTCRPLYLPPYPTDAPFGIRHLLRTAQSGLEAKLYPLPLKAG